MTKSLYIFFCCVILFTTYHQAFSQGTNLHDKKLVSKYDSLLKIAPREKIYVHLDRATFVPQDTLWFKAYLVDANTNSFSKISGLVYFEIVDATGVIIQTMSMPTSMGLTWAGFALKPEIYKQGSYTFRAYTNWMQNFGQTYIFSKSFKILDFLKEEQITEVETKRKVKSPKIVESPAESQQAIDLQFLPESGIWLAEKNQKMAFKALGQNGKGIKISGSILDSKQQLVANFNSNEMGMGYFEMIPTANENYEVKVNEYQNLKKINFPKATTYGAYFRLFNYYNTDSISIQAYSDLPEQELTIIGQSRGTICFQAQIKSRKQYRPFKIAKSLFPTGVCQILLQNTKGQIINERSFFINHNDDLKINALSSNLIYNIRDSISVNLSVSDDEGKPISGAFSIAVTDDNQIKKDSLNDENILSYILLSSDLKGEIEQPGYYFQKFDETKHNDLEALMLTQAWVSYNWNEYKKPVFIAEKDFKITGKVTNMLNKPVNKANMILMGMKKYSTVIDTVTNDKGEFVFDNFPQLDSASFIIQARNSKNKVGTLGVQLNEFKNAPFVSPIKKRGIINVETPDSLSQQFIDIKNEEYKVAFKSGINLREVKIVGKKIIKNSKNLNGAGNADQVLSEEDMDKVAKRTLLNVLEDNLKGFKMKFGKDGTSFYVVNSDIFKLIIDGIDVDFFYERTGIPGNEYINYINSYLKYYTAEDIKGMEVMGSRRYSNTYRSRFLDPRDDKEYTFVEITTRTGEGPFIKKVANMYKYKPQFSYGDSKVFYSPRYTAVNKPDKKPDYRSTIFWQPNLITDANGSGSFSFFSADKKGSYTVWIEGADMNGNFGFKTLSLKIN
ncbi:hypothetical protein [Pedobacter aquatilis]|uniref:hypothetical protein n=1 Tax=Pedobacter aquatilis TaxID=351343 RepID=UPI002930076E|nr:hypothetical protein [Pedobacter aquatilis]